MQGEHDSRFAALQAELSVSKAETETAKADAETAIKEASAAGVLKIQHLSDRTAIVSCFAHVCFLLCASPATSSSLRLNTSMLQYAWGTSKQCFVSTLSKCAASAGDEEDGRELEETQSRC